MHFTQTWYLGKTYGNVRRTCTIAKSNACPKKMPELSFSPSNCLDKWSKTSHILRHCRKSLTWDEWKFPRIQLMQTGSPSPHYIPSEIHQIRHAANERRDVFILTHDGGSFVCSSAGYENAEGGSLCMAGVIQRRLSSYQDPKVGSSRRIL